jgi:hypothetical protein
VVLGAGYANVQMNFETYCRRIIDDQPEAGGFYLASVHPPAGFPRGLPAHRSAPDSTTSDCSAPRSAAQDPEHIARFPAAGLGASGAVSSRRQEAQRAVYVDRGSRALRVPAL